MPVTAMPTASVQIVDSEGRMTPEFQRFLQSVFEELRRLRTENADLIQRINDLENP